ncbi:hypothetical protein L1987_12319 [Smallanthus sonchifolius]|uniref:Uncharacterized protein n=1 Tax=Smallanthus sonchifolius TaxID=185202 RepID=A0ACB9JG26_9ASTR|nr:hypothetical protein L1987_12319 [Smallanthus sonchifolius]
MLNFFFLEETSKRGSELTKLVIYKESFALKIKIVEIFGCSLGQGLKTSTFYGEILFAYFIAVIGLVLFALLIGNMQNETHIGFILCGMLLENPAWAELGPIGSSERRVDFGLMWSRGDRANIGIRAMLESHARERFKKSHGRKRVAATRNIQKARAFRCRPKVVHNSHRVDINQKGKKPMVANQFVSITVKIWVITHIIPLKSKVKENLKILEVMGMKMKIQINNMKKLSLWMKRSAYRLSNHNGEETLEENRERLWNYVEKDNNEASTTMGDSFFPINVFSVQSCINVMDMLKIHELFMKYQEALKSETIKRKVQEEDELMVQVEEVDSNVIKARKKYLQSFSNLTLRMEEMKEKRREAEDLMSYMSLPEVLRQRVRRHTQYKWKITRGVELDSFVRDLPHDLRRDIKRHLCSTLLMRVLLAAVEDLGSPLHTDCMADTL